MSDDLRRKREAYFDALTRDASARRSTKTARATTKTRDEDARDGTRARETTTTTATATTGRARGAPALRAPALRLTSARGSARGTASGTRAARAGRATITGIPAAPMGDPCDLDLEKHDGRRFARVRLPTAWEGGETRAQIFPNGPVVTVTAPEGARGGDEIEFAVEPWTVEDVPPKPPGGRGETEEEEAPPPPPPGEPPTEWGAGRAPPPPPPPPPPSGIGFAPMGAVDVPPPPPGSP